MGSAVSASEQGRPTMSLFKALLLSALAVTAKAAPTEVVAGRVVTHAVAAQAEAPAQYNFGYSITDSVTGDSKSRQESRDGDVVRGSYRVADPDGRIRTVTYTADAVHGFQAHVTYDGEEGPVVVPLNASPTAVVRSDPLHFTSAPQPVLTAVRTVPVVAAPSLHTTHAVQNLDKAVTVLRGAPAVQTTQGVQALHPLGHAVTAVRTVPSVEATHLVQNLALGGGPTVHRNGNVFRTLHHLPSAHDVHSLPHDITAVRRVPTAQAVRTIQAAPASQAVNNLGAGLTAVRSLPSLQSVRRSPFFLRSSNLGTQLDLSQFRFVNAGQVI